MTGNAAAVEIGLDTALSRGTLDPLLYGMHGVRAQMLMQHQEYRSAAHWAGRAATTPGAHYLIGMIAVVAHGLAGDQGEAARWRTEVRRRRPDASARDYFTAFPTRDGPSRTIIAAELRRQGF